MKHNKNLSIEQQTVLDCPILYQMRNRPCTETCCCWGWEFSGNGFDEAAKDMSYEMETLNKLFYPKYRTRIQIDQIKSKFGYFTCYHSIVTDHGKFLTFILDNIQKFSDFCLKHEFNVKYIVDIEPYDYDRVEEISKEEYKNNLKLKYKISNVSYVKKNGSYKKITHLRNYGKKHAEPTTNKIWWYLGNKMKSLGWKLDNMFNIQETSDVRRVVNYLDTKATEIIKKTEERCLKTCEQCGNQIGTEWSPTCTTLGWIENLCRDCAKKQNSNYTMNGKIYNKGEEVKTSKKTKK